VRVSTAVRYGACGAHALPQGDSSRSNLCAPASGVFPYVKRAICDRLIVIDSITIKRSHMARLIECVCATLFLEHTINCLFIQICDSAAGRTHGVKLDSAQRAAAPKFRVRDTYETPSPPPRRQKVIKRVSTRLEA
jgi:hypothetical protein